MDKSLSEIVVIVAIVLIVMSLSTCEVFTTKYKYEYKQKELEQSDNFKLYLKEKIKADSLQKELTYCQISLISN